MTYDSPPLESAGEVRVTYEDAGPLNPMPYDEKALTTNAEKKVTDIAKRFVLFVFMICVAVGCVLFGCACAYFGLDAAWDIPLEYPPPGYWGFVETVVRTAAFGLTVVVSILAGVVAAVMGVLLALEGVLVLVGKEQRL